MTPNLRPRVGLHCVYTVTAVTDIVQEPLVVLPGGYAQWWDGVTWNVITNFRKGGLGSDGAFYG